MIMWLLHVLLATTLLILSAANLRVAEAFVTTPALAASRAPQIALASFTLSLQAKQSKKEEDEEDEDDDEDDAMTASLGDWRSFRASLISKSSSSSNNSGGEPNQPTTSVAQENEGTKRKHAFVFRFFSLFGSMRRCLLMFYTISLFFYSLIGTTKSSLGARIQTWRLGSHDSMAGSGRFVGPHAIGGGTL